MKAKPLQYLCALGLCSSNPLVNRLLHMSVAKYAIHFLWKGLPAYIVLRCVDYMVVQDVVSGYPGFTNVATKFPRLSVDEVIYGGGLPESGGRRIVRPEQKSVFLMTDTDFPSKIRGI